MPIDAQQGRTRIERANRWRDALASAAEARGICRNARVHILPECGHDFEDCVRTGGLLNIVFAAGGPDPSFGEARPDHNPEMPMSETGVANAT